MRFIAKLQIERQFRILCILSNREIYGYFHKNDEKIIPFIIQGLLRDPSIVNAHDDDDLYKQGHENKYGIARKVSDAKKYRNSYEGEFKIGLEKRRNENFCNFV